jgi:hypothetical protein
VATTLGRVAGGLVASLPQAGAALAALAAGTLLPSALALLTSLVSVPLVGAVVGLCQRQVLRAAGRATPWWVLVAVASWSLYLLAPGLVDALLPPPTDDEAGALYGALRVGLAWAAGGAAYGACQGWAVTRDPGQTRRWALWSAGASLVSAAAGWLAAEAVVPAVSLWNLVVAALARAERVGRWDADTFDEGYRRLAELHPELSRGDVAPHARLLRLGTRLWREGRREREVEDETAIFRVPDWAPEAVQAWLEWTALRAAHACRRASWLTALLDSTLVWSEAGLPSARLLVIEGGEIVQARAVDAVTPPPTPPGHRRPIGEKRQAFTLARYDRLTVLTGELKRITATGAPLALRLGATAPLTGARLAAALSWV